ncbi:MAG: hypothetical protein JO336_17440, partial [Acidobacteriia bacterium]|nr:hypothetical protein [Terriglobia bacterium]
MRKRVLTRVIRYLCLSMLPFGVRAGTFTAAGTALTVTSANLQATFRGADVVGVSNQLTGESYFRNPSPNTQLNLTLTQTPSQALSASSAWTVNAAGSSASLSFTDSNRTVTVTVSVDPATQEVVVDLDGKANQGGVERLSWGAIGFDMTAGNFVVPAQGGLAITSASLAANGAYNFFGTGWEAPLSIFQGTKGGVAIYSTDTKSLCKDLTITPDQQGADEAFLVEAPSPFSTAAEAGPIEWRLAGYAGDWQAGARIYRNWHNHAMPPAPLTRGRAWVNGIQTVIEVGDQPYQISQLDSLATVVTPSETLLYLVNWRAQAYDVGYPDYSWSATTPQFIAYAHKLGFYVMLHTDALGVSPSSADFAGVQQYQIKDPLSLQPQGWNWNESASTPNRYALIDPAASAYRTLFVARVTPAVQTLQPDALHLDFSVIENDGNGPIGGMNFNQGLAQLERDLLAAFPSLALGVEEVNDMIAPWASFSQPLYWSGMGLTSNTTPPTPISAYVLPNVNRYWHLGVTNPYEGGFVANLSQYEAQAVLPTFHSDIPDYTQADMARYLNVVSAFQKYSLQPAWDSAWNGAEVHYGGTNGSSASLTDSGTAIQLTLNQPSASTVLYQRAHGVNQVNSSFSVLNWPAWNGSLTLGLDPADQYWLDTPAHTASQTHITALSSGARLGVGTGSLVTSQFSYFQLLPPVQETFNFLSSLALASPGVTYNAMDYRLENGATANLSSMTVGGVTMQGIFMQPPFTAQRGGDAFVDFTVPISGNQASLSFAAGIIDSAIGQRQGPMTFKVEIDGTDLWQQDVSTRAWQYGSIDVRPWQGQTVAIRFVSDPGPSGNPNFGWGGFAAIELTAAVAESLSGIAITGPQSLTAAQLAVTGGTASVSNGAVTVNNLPNGGTVLLLNGQATAVTAGQNLFNAPFTLSQSANGQLAGPPTGAFGGTGRIQPATSGGVTKQQALNGFGPSDGQTIFSWLLQLPANPLGFSFSAGFWDNEPPPLRPFLMSVRVNGVFLWQHSIGVPTGWQYGAIDLSAWSGQTVLLELVTDTQGSNAYDFTSWGDLAFSAAGTGNCASTLNNSNPVSAAASGTSGTITVAIGAGCDWTAASSADWITLSPA